MDSASQRTQFSWLSAATADLSSGKITFCNGCRQIQIVPIIESVQRSTSRALFISTAAHQQIVIYRKQILVQSAIANLKS